MSGTIRRRVLFSGNVQGVGFRYTAYQLAQGYRVGGYVKNLPDGRVELVAEGATDEVRRFIEALEDQMRAHIRGASATDEPSASPSQHFSVAH
ncbi:MAG TPA: acylphosphatase [Phycisphaerae bacterium]|jgi:acylphosphatase